MLQWPTLHGTSRSNSQQNAHSLAGPGEGVGEDKAVGDDVQQRLGAARVNVLRAAWNGAGWGGLNSGQLGLGQAGARGPAAAGGSLLRCIAAVWTVRRRRASAWHTQRLGKVHQHCAVVPTQCKLLPEFGLPTTGTETVICTSALGRLSS